ncbi:ISAon1 family transposase, partial [Bizionia gelidisalsuginis]|uniref:ISAon1 family transposase n=1 Tax=Bizionia gelidisalsuginis TaxID=291188 RepID=UPI001FEB0CCF
LTKQHYPKGELYTIITNKKAKGKKGAIVAIFSGTKVEPIVEQMLKTPIEKRIKVLEITLDMANSMKTIAKRCFPKAIQVTDRFHVQKLALEALQNIRIKHRWEAIDLENEEIKQARTFKKGYQPRIFTNGDTRKQLLARSRYLLYKAPSKWTGNQYQRSKILFNEYPDIKIAHNLMQELRTLFNTASSIKLAHWHNQVEKSGFKGIKRKTWGETLSLTKTD